MNFFGSCIESVITFKYLGVVFDSHMTWKDQADHQPRTQALSSGKERPWLELVTWLPDFGC